MTLVRVLPNGLHPSGIACRFYSTLHSVPFSVFSVPLWLATFRAVENIGGRTFERFSTNERHLDDPESSDDTVWLPPLG